MMKRSRERQRVLKALAKARGPIGPNEIAAVTGMRAVNIRCLLGKLIKDFAVSKVAYGRYVRRTTPFSARELQLRSR